MTKERCYTLVDKFCMSLDQARKTLMGTPPHTHQPYPAEHNDEVSLTKSQSQHSAGLMRVNHAGEICAQALYHGQAMVSRTKEVQEKMNEAAVEEGDHLLWCQKRLQELGSHVSYLNPLWYTGSFCIGMGAGLIGDKWSLGFVAETERQVIHHLEKHLIALPEQDKRSYQILVKMRNDEAKHRDEALSLGAKQLPTWMQVAMSWASKIMVKTAYWV